MEYFVLNNDNEKFYIFSRHSRILYLEYIYHIRENRLEENKTMKFEDYRIKNNFVYSSNNLTNLLKMLPTLAVANKYNL